MDFLFNRQNKYSIRRFTIGTASILVGTTLVFGINHHEAKAAENTTDASVTITDHLNAENETVNQAGQDLKKDQATQNNNDVQDKVNLAHDLSTTDETSNKAQTNNVKSTNHNTNTRNINEMSDESSSTDSNQETLRNNMVIAIQDKATETDNDDEKVNETTLTHNSATAISDSDSEPLSDNTVTI
ncbi:YSIRK-type signal peptide-containing protein [Staphylococcus saccharolyticus]|uniref:YSIRK-type signal peptide-containing protein n=1 Tax=Staphylococcus saccharolyticus TaxID=33028 RepID=UPI00102DB2DD|nr:YSIRK-type signal peptide-containing protein [Staphylococcus saccharolyticus]MBL7573837.1 YSIRK-type signal peptide-containing protein [Staphylococcus saccharolyticus]MBL7584375.1 YSIRK-type signal peptide-containing protein [Staphylococcus saccharolyticus]MBL7639238.1 YSIRK-type signal peptide-containing protein [Staphylococcus saccharolyticus]QRJ68561.1 YSIRK-type signal peptide-containing protein [Staphylococcus saccharolyticus]TAA91878.1 hypothetical protein DMB74_07015 [Staphylococcus 